MSELQTLARERSVQDAKAALDLGRMAGQSAVLINGGAATALLVFAEKSGTGFSHYVLAFGLLIYAGGALLGALMIWAFAQRAEHSATHWENVVVGLDPTGVGGPTWRVGYWTGGALVFFTTSIICFFVGTFVIALSLAAHNS